MAEDREEIGAFVLADHHFACFLPDGPDEPQVWTIVVTKDGREVRRETVPLMYEPRFGPDVGDCAARDERVEEIIKELGLE